MGMLDWDQCIESLRNHVVRVVFVKKGNGNFREMWATRNIYLIQDQIGFDASIKLGSDNRENELKQRNNNNIVVLDLEKNEFRTIPLDNVVAVDQFTGVPGWVEFNFTEPWQKVIKGKPDIYKYLNG
jgi:hypothetical protein